MSEFYHLLIHYRLSARLKELSLARRKALQKTCERLQLGYWGNGTRVKMLKGLSRLVYEARIDKAWRLLFTVVRRLSDHPPFSMEPHLLLWDWVEHDKVARARRINLQPECGFLDFQELASLDIKKPPAHPDLQVPLPRQSEPEILERILSDPSPPPNSESDEYLDSVRWYVLSPDIVTNEAKWQELLEQADTANLDLKLSPEQARLVDAPGLVLLRGSAGSGKTTVSVYRLARIALRQPQARILFVTYSSALMESAHQLYDNIFKSRLLPRPPAKIDFLTMPVLCRRIAGLPSDSAEPIRFPYFQKWMRDQQECYDPGFVWEEIRAILKGACRDPRLPHLDLSQYQALGRKRAPLFAQERLRIWKIFEKYRAHCLEQNRLDDIDLARQAICKVVAGKGPCYDYLFCDEGQDLTEIEMDLLLRLVIKPDGLFFTADPQQIVNPSGFRWAEIRSLLREINQRKPPEVFSLSRNYRSVRGIVGLANALLQLQRERTGRSDDDDFQNSSLLGATPVCVTGDSQQVLKQIRDFGPRCAVIAPTEKLAEMLRQKLQSERVFSVVASKGLEFEACLLWDFFSYEAESWRQLLVDNEHDLKENVGLRRVIHHAYVAITRARRYLAFYESNPESAALWQTPRLRAHVEMDEVAALSRFLVFAASPEEWYQQGEYFYRRERFRQAAECFQRAGAPERETECLARYYDSIGEYAQAAEKFLSVRMFNEAAACWQQAQEHIKAAKLYAQIGEHLSAAMNFEKAKSYDLAAQHFLSASKKEDYLRCQLLHYESQHNWLEAGRFAAANKLWDQAISYFDRIQSRQEATKCRIQKAIAENRWPEAARLAEQSGRLQRAVIYFARAGLQYKQDRYRCQATLWEKAGEWGKAFRFWKVTGNAERSFDCYIRHLQTLGEWQRAAMLLESNHRKEGAQALIKQYQSQPEARLWLNAYEYEQLPQPDYFQVLQLFFQAGNYYRVWSLAKKLVPTYPFFPKEKVRLPEGQDSAIVNLGLRAGLHHAEKYDAGHFVLVQKRLLFVMKKWVIEEQVFALFRQVGEKQARWSSLAKLEVKLGHWQKAADYFQKAGSQKMSHQMMAKAAELEERWSEAAQNWELGGKTRNSTRCQARFAEAQSDWQLARKLYNQIQMLSKVKQIDALLAAAEQTEKKLAEEPRQQAFSDGPPLSSLTNEDGRCAS